MLMLQQSFQYPAVTVCMFVDYHASSSSKKLMVNFDDQEEVEEYINRLNNIISRHIYFNRLAANG